MSPRESLANYQRLRALLAGQRPLPSDLRQWLLNGLREFETGRDLDVALGLRLKQGHRYTAGSLCRRSDMECDLIQVADLIGPRDGGTAGKIARALAGEVGHIPSVALDFLVRAHVVHGNAIPTSKNAISMIIKGETRAALYGLTS